MKTFSYIFYVSMLMVLSACGGGGSSSSAPATNSPAQGLWVGTTNTNRTISALVLGDGTYYVLYTAEGSASSIEGFSQGSGTATASPWTFTSSDLKDFNFVGLGVNAATLSATYTTKQKFDGTITYTGGTTTTFTSTYDTQYETVPSLATLAGSYTGTAVVVSTVNIPNTPITISSSGAISSSSNGCTMTGTTSPRSEGNAYNISLTFAANGCAAAVAGQTMTGVAYYASATKSMYIFAPNAARTGGVFYVGTKP